LSLATASPTSDVEAIRASLREQPDGVLDDVARRHGVSLRVVLDLLPGAAAKSASGARFVDIWGDLVDWGPVTFIVHTEDGVFETKAPLPPGNEARGYFNIHGERVRLAATCALRDAPRSILSTVHSLDADLARCSSSTSMAAPCSRSLSGAMKSANCSQTSLFASSGCGTPRRLQPDSESQGGRWPGPITPALAGSPCPRAESVRHQRRLLCR
jgi:hypothetical protein